MAVYSSVGSSGSVGPTSGGRIYAYNNLGTTQMDVAPANPSRTRITFHNPGPVDFIVAPKFVQTNGSNVGLGITPTIYGGGFRVYGNGGTLVIDGECQGGWQAVALSGSTNPITVMDSNI